jgi:hypothetical protein
MKSKYVSCFLPSKGNLSVKTKLLKVPDHEETIYDAMGFFEDEADVNVNLEYFPLKIKRDVLLRNIVNLHDEGGLKPLKIKKMLSSLENGEFIGNKKIPNIKIIKTKENKMLVFDGHHSILSYLSLGKRYLSEIPHMLIESENGYFEDDEISVFFGNHQRKIKNQDWRDYVINWNNSSRNQIQVRRRNNIGEVFDALNFS